MTSVFPPNDYFLLAVILLLPLVGAFVNGVFGKRLGREAVSLMALSAVGGSFLASVGAFLTLRDLQMGSDTAARLSWTGWKWMDVSGRTEGVQIPIEIAFSLDALSGTMALVVTGVGFLIHLYSTKYMEHDEGYYRFFAYLNLFVFSMLVLILGDNLPVLFVGWEGVGLCSYLLIGFWFKDEANAQAGKKAFITNRIGDFGLLVAMALLLYHVGALDWRGIENGARGLLTPVDLWPIGRGGFLAVWDPEASVLVSIKAWLLEPRQATAATLVGLCIFLGCAGKSAQIPLYVWLPDAMAGPTPVSALIHAATMVTAGVYLCCRMSFVLVLSPAVMFTIAVVGLATALLAATIAFVQNDIKKVLAYSTVSQLGYMFLGVGVGAFTAGFFHVMTHAFFKGCLFLGAGSVIHAMHARIHDTENSQDMRRMGGLREFMPHTYWTFGVSCLAIAGLPFVTSGFYSKDEILFKAYTTSIAPPVPDGKLGEFQMWLWPDGASTWLFVFGVLGAVMTAFYMFRLFFRTFWGEFKGWTIVRHWKEPEHEAHDDHDHAHDPDAPLEGPKPHESPLQMTVPLMVLGALAVVAGFLNAHPLGLHAFDDWLAPVFKAAQGSIVTVENAKALMWPLLVPGILAFAGGVGGAYWVYVMQGGTPAAELAERFPGLHRLVFEKWRVDELYEETVIGAVDSLAEFAIWFDKWVVDGIISRFTAFVVAATGSIVRLLQTGRVQAYAALMVVGVAAFGWFFASPHASTVVSSDAETGKFTVTASPGLGYSYRWDADGDGTVDSEEFGDGRTIELVVGVDEKKTVRVEVKNAFGRIAARDVVLERARKDLSAPRAAGDATEAGRLAGRAVP